MDREKNWRIDLTNLFFAAADVTIQKYLHTRETVNYSAINDCPISFILMVIPVASTSTFSDKKTLDNRYHDRLTCALSSRFPSRTWDALSPSSKKKTPPCWFSISSRHTHKVDLKSSIQPNNTTRAPLYDAVKLRRREETYLLRSSLGQCVCRGSPFSFKLPFIVHMEMDTMGGKNKERVCWTKEREAGRPCPRSLYQHRWQVHYYSTGIIQSTCVKLNQASTLSLNY